MKKASELFNEDVVTKIKLDIIEHEGIVYAVYKDHLGNKTLGIGHLVTKDDPEYGLAIGYVVEEDRVMELFEEDVEEAFKTANDLVPLLYARPIPVQRVIVNMAFQLGYNKLSRFTKTLAHVHQCQYNEAADEMLRSLWARQTPKRARHLSELMRSAYTPPRRESEDETESGN